MSQLQPGQPAPDFELLDQSGASVRLGDLRGKSAVVLFFYPKDDTTGCTIEACAFRDEMPQFDALGAKIIGVSSDSSDSHTRFSAKHNLGYTLLSDPGGKVKKLFGLKNAFGILPARVTFVIDRNGIIRHVFSSQTQFQKHIQESLQALERG